MLLSLKYKMGMHNICLRHKSGTSSYSEAHYGTDNGSTNL